MIHTNKNENIGYTKEKAYEEFWVDAQNYGKNVGCIIPDKPSLWHNFSVFSNANMLYLYIKTFMMLDEDISLDNNSCRKVQAMKAINAIQRARVEGHSIFLGLVIGVLGFGIPVVTSLADIYIKCGEIFAYFVFLVYCVLGVIILYYPFYYSEASIKSSATNDAIELFERKCCVKNTQKEK